MKTLKLSALALGMLVAGSAIAYPGESYVDAAVERYTNAVVSRVMSLSTQGYHKMATCTAGLLAPVYYPKTTIFAVAAITAGVIAYKKYSAKKKKIEVEETEEEQTEVEVTVQ